MTIWKQAPKQRRDPRFFDDNSTLTETMTEVRSCPVAEAGYVPQKMELLAESVGHCFTAGRGPV